MSEKTALTVPTKFEIAPLQSKISAEQMVQQMMGLSVALDRMIFPASTSDSFSVPDGKGDTVPMKKVPCVILHHYATKAYWEDKNTGAAVPPKCSSRDLIHGSCLGGCVDTQGMPLCKWNKFGSAVNEDGSEGNGKACKDMHPLFIIVEGFSTPIQFTIPPSSLNPKGELRSAGLSKYIFNLIQSGYLPEEVITEITLKKGNNGKFNFNVAQFHKKDVLSDAQFAEITKMKQSYMPLFENVTILSDDYSTTPDPGEVINISGNAVENTGTEDLY